MAVMIGAVRLAATATSDLSSTSFPTEGLRRDCRQGRCGALVQCLRFSRHGLDDNTEVGAPENGLSHATAGKNTSARQGDPHITLHHTALAEAKQKGDCARVWIAHMRELTLAGKGQPLRRGSFRAESGAQDKSGVSPPVNRPAIAGRCAARDECA